MLRGMADATLRIGELARRSGVSADLLRAWERRYALLTPVRTAGGYRLYSADDEARVRSMQAHLAQGLSAAEAARLVRDATAPAPQNGAPADLAAALWSALDGFDDAGAQAAFDRLVAAFSIEAVAETAILPYLRTLGDRWRDGDASVAQEHFATGLLRRGCWAWRAAGTAAPVLARCSPARQANATTSGSSSSASRCATAAGA